MNKILFNLLFASMFLGVVHEASAGKFLKGEEKRDWKKSPKTISSKSSNMAEKGYTPCAPFKKGHSLTEKENLILDSNGILWLRPTAAAFLPTSESNAESEVRSSSMSEQGYIPCAPFKKKHVLSQKENFLLDSNGILWLRPKAAAFLPTSKSNAESKIMRTIENGRIQKVKKTSPRDSAINTNSSQELVQTISAPPSVIPEIIITFEG